MKIFAVWIILYCQYACCCSNVNAQSVGVDPPPSWMRGAVIYGIKPSAFTDKPSFLSIIKKLPEIQQLGVNTIWLQPVYKTAKGGQGYDIIDFFSVRQDLGDSAQLRQLVDSAHRLNMKVIFDFVPNHTSLQHPWAVDIMEKGKESAYFDYYQHENDHAPYSSFYHRDENDFIYYFWKNLVNLNYSNSSVQQTIIEACKYWITEFGIDGYRFDASWAVRARNPPFFNLLRKELKSVKHDILLLAEDKGADTTVYSQGFDAAYDWTSDTAWVSHWPWEYEHDAKSSRTIFRHPSEQKRIELLRRVLFTNNPYQHRILRFMENNDLPRFIQYHSIEQTRMAAALLFALPGIPLVFGGQEAGVNAHPYTSKPIFRDSIDIIGVDSHGLYTYYQQLITDRKKYAAMTSANIEEVKTEGDGCVAFRRWEGDQQLVVVVNPTSVAAHIRIPKRANKFVKKTHAMIVPPFTTRWLLLKNDSLTEIKSS